MDIKKSWRLVVQIRKKVNELYKNWTLAFIPFGKYFRKMHNNKKVTKNIKIK